MLKSTVRDLPLRSRSLRRWLIALAVLALMVLLTGCDGSESDEAAGTPTAESTPEATAGPAPGSPPESGEAPVFWRDGGLFRDVHVNDNHKVVVRVTNGYDADTLLVRLEPVDGAGESQEIEAVRSEPVGEEAPGHYYAFNMNVPAPGTWRLTATPGEDTGSITFEVVA